MDIWNSLEWNALFEYFVHDCSVVILASSAALCTLAMVSRLCKGKRTL